MTLDSTSRILLVEFRDELFARVAGDLKNNGYLAIRAVDTADVLKLYSRHEPMLVVCNRDLPDASGWLTAVKLKMLDPGARIWIYAARFSIFDRGWAKHTGIQHLIEYAGDIFDLSSIIADCLHLARLDDRPRP
jgi:DNA-binding response OmpR family regulator